MEGKEPIKFKSFHEKVSGSSKCTWAVYQCRHHTFTFFCIYVQVGSGCGPGLVACRDEELKKYTKLDKIDQFF